MNGVSAVGTVQEKGSKSRKLGGGKPLWVPQVRRMSGETGFSVPIKDDNPGICERMYTEVTVTLQEKNAHHATCEWLE